MSKMRRRRGIRGFTITGEDFARALAAVLNPNYLGATDEYLASNTAPKCPQCGREMAAEDDHGRFRCLYCWVGRDVVADVDMPVPDAIPQVDTSGMTNAQKAQVDPINRLHSEPTEAEKAYFAVMAKGPDAMDTQEYRDAVAALEKERGER